ncbi:hypothetical protein IT402_02660 [Candidatus Nomurabacteria bacterium]|nr:hypothetical protein [Candidatus Nomurabacteria bacterium]
MRGIFNLTKDSENIVLKKIHIMDVLQKFNYGKIHGSLNNLEIIRINPPENLKEFLANFREKKKFNFTKEFLGLILDAEIALEVRPDSHEISPFDLGCLSIEGQISSAQIGNFLCSQEGVEFKFKDNPLFDTSIKEHLMVYAILEIITNQPNLICLPGHNIFTYRAGEKYNRQSVVEKRSKFEGWHYFEDYYTTQAFHVTGEKLFFPILKSAL